MSWSSTYEGVLRVCIYASHKYCCLLSTQSSRVWVQGPVVDSQGTCVVAKVHFAALTATVTKDGGDPTVHVFLVRVRDLTRRLTCTTEQHLAPLHYNPHQFLTWMSI